jgi:hypothetical protein
MLSIGQTIHVLSTRRVLWPTLFATAGSGELCSSGDVEFHAHMDSGAQVRLALGRDCGPDLLSSG